MVKNNRLQTICEPDHGAAGAMICRERGRDGNFVAINMPNLRW